MSQSSNKLKVECLMGYLKTLRTQSKSTKVEKPEYRVNTKGMKSR